MKARKWLIILLAIVVTTMSTATYAGVTESLFTDDEQSTDDALGLRWGFITLDDGFEGLCRVYYEDPLKKRSIERLNALAEQYKERPVHEYADLLIGILYYGSKDYNKALNIFEKIQKENPKSPYWYTTETLINDIKDIKK